MVNKLSRYFHTLRHLKWIQIRYQLWYRLRTKFFPVKYEAPKFEKLDLQKVNLDSFPFQHKHFLGAKKFTFLNIDKDFESGIDWNFLDHGKLWTYHLNYFDYLHQSEMDWVTGKGLILEFLANPEERIDGMEPYPISLRTINWVKFLYKHNHYPPKIIEALYAQLLVLNKKVEYHLMGNHILENGFALLFGAVFFEDEKFTRSARKILKRELEEQILDDGAHFELSPMYHIIILHRALDTYNLLKNKKHSLTDIECKLEEVIQKMVNWLSIIMFRSGDIPMLNDSTYGQALEPKVIINYAQQLGFSPEKIMLNQSGYRKFEFGGFEMVVDAAEVGPDYQPGHAHSDTLAFILYHNELPIVVDRGISTYEKNSIREDERSTFSHNTVVINNEEQTDTWGGFRVGKRARPLIFEESNNVLKVSHTGYDHLGLRHIREIKAQDGLVTIIDNITKEGIDAKAYVHFHPGIEVYELENGHYKIGEIYLKIEGAIKIETSSYSFCLGFNNTESAHKLVVSFKNNLKMNFSE